MKKNFSGVKRLLISATITIFLATTAFTALLLMPAHGQEFNSPTAPRITVTPEGRLFTAGNNIGIVARSFVDPQDGVTFTFDLGDGTAVTLGGERISDTNEFRVEHNHVYTAGTYTITVTVGDGLENTATNSVQIQIVSEGELPPPHITIGKPSAGSSGPMGSFSSSPGPDLRSCMYYPWYDIVSFSVLTVDPNGGPMTYTLTVENTRQGTWTRTSGDKPRILNDGTERWVYYTLGDSSIFSPGIYTLNVTATTASGATSQNSAQFRYLECDALPTIGDPLAPTQPGDRPGEDPGGSPGGSPFNGDDIFRGSTPETLFGGFIERSTTCTCLTWDDIPLVHNPWIPPYFNEGMTYKGRLIHINEPNPQRVLTIYKPPMDYLDFLVGWFQDIFITTKVYRHGPRTHEVGHWVLGRNYPVPELPCRDINWGQSFRRSAQLAACLLRRALGFGGNCTPRTPLATWVTICHGPKGGGGELSAGFPSRIIGSGLDPDPFLPETNCSWTAEGYVCSGVSGPNGNGAVGNDND